MAEENTKTEQETTTETTVKKENWFKKIVSIVWKWIKSGYKWVAIAFAAVVSFILFKKADHLIQLNDQKKKQKAKNDAKETKEKIEESSAKVEDIKTDVSDVKEEIKEDKEELKKSEETYKEKQVKTATAAGFTKD